MNPSSRYLFGKGRTFLSAGAFLATILATLPGEAATPSSPGADFTLSDVRSLTTWIVPAQTRGWVGVQGRERKRRMTVTPGNRFLGILKCHAERYLDSKARLNLSEAQKAKIRSILARTRDRIVPMDARDLFLVQHFEAMVASPTVDVARLSRLNELIGSLEGDEAGVFVDGLKSLQGVLTSRQLKALKAKNGDFLPVSDVDLTGAVFLADRILSIRWNILERSAGFSSADDQASRLSHYLAGRREIHRLGIEMTVWDKKSRDILYAPYVDLRKLGALEAKSGPVEGRFWGTLIKTVGQLNPSPSPEEGKGRP